ncbi:hypothetical protein IQE94_00380 [Synechocystis sp. PCC 7339]|uniref:hypothetical protein n=1 Tax=unclassified Synechocystis TaxID=2640012 RepID=UPI001BAF6FF9|nr:MULTISPECIES: hypothetical protein [unclassified Synechocystis]QUS60681.1 hypothetical protein HTZ78_08345 [Synechocystis sp. PCC 7338]UAJ72866.1 hypothetical protein IQE94_00380 [Synechocystis sp. PCC 7339]
MLKKIFILLVLLAIAGAGLGYYFWRRATQIPTWFEAETSTPSIATPANFLQEKIRREVAQENNGDRQEPVRVTLTEKELGQVLQGEVGRQLKMESVPRLQTQIRGESLEVGTVLDPQILTNAQLSPGQQRIVDQVLPLLPSQNQPFYVGIEGAPQLEAGQLIMTKNSRIKIGELSFSVGDVAQRLNIPPEKLNQLLQVNLEELNLQGLQIEDGTVQLEVNPQR